MIIEITEDASLREAVAVKAPELIGCDWLAERTPGEARVTTQRLIAQLEESKFMRFFREFGLDDIPERTTTPLDFPDSEIFVTTFEDDHACLVFTAFDQVVHLPATLWRPEFAELLLEEHLRRAFRNLKPRQDLLRALDGSRTVERGRELFGHNDEQMPEEYCVFTNIPDDVLGDRNKLSDFATVLCHRMLDIPLPYCPNFHFVTPDSIVRAPLGDRRVTEFLVDLLNTPSSYYLVAREGHISAAPMTEHGTFFASGIDPGNVDEVLPATVTSTLPKSQLTIAFEELLNSPNTKERDIQAFLEAHMELLFAFDERYCEIKPHVCLIDSRGERLIPDIMARLQGAKLWELIELKMPRHPVTVLHGQTERPSAQAARGIAELLAYRDFFCHPSNRKRVADSLGAAPYEPCLVLVIGRGQPNCRYTWESSRPGIPTVQIVSYDYIFENAREYRRMLNRS